MLQRHTSNVESETSDFCKLFAHFEFDVTACFKKEVGGSLNTSWEFLVKQLMSLSEFQPPSSFMPDLEIESNRYSYYLTIIIRSVIRNISGTVKLMLVSGLMTADVRSLKIQSLHHCSVHQTVSHQKIEHELHELKQRLVHEKAEMNKLHWENI